MKYFRKDLCMQGNCGSEILDISYKKKENYCTMHIIYNGKDMLVYFIGVERISTRFSDATAGRTALDLGYLDLQKLENGLVSGLILFDLGNQMEVISKTVRIKESPSVRQ